MSGAKYQNIIQRLIELKTGGTMRKTSKDYRLLKQYEIITTQDNDNLIQILQKPATELIYVPQEYLFDVIRYF